MRAGKYRNAYEIEDLEIELDRLSAERGAAEADFRAAREAGDPASIELTGCRCDDLSDRIGDIKNLLDDEGVL